MFETQGNDFKTPPRSKAPPRFSYEGLLKSANCPSPSFLVKIYQFEFLVMTEKNIFAYELFLSLNISLNISYFLCENCSPPEKCCPYFPATPSKSWSPVKPPSPSFLKICLEFQPPSRRGVEDAQYENKTVAINWSKNYAEIVKFSYVESINYIIGILYCRLQQVLQRWKTLSHSGISTISK